MPITSVGSWLQTIDEFLAHWTDVNTALAPRALTLIGDYTRSVLATDCAAVECAIRGVTNKDTMTLVARRDRDLMRSIVRPRFI